MRDLDLSWGRAPSVPAEDGMAAEGVKGCTRIARHPSNQDDVAQIKKYEEIGQIFYYFNLFGNLISSLDAFFHLGISPSPSSSSSSSSSSSQFCKKKQDCHFWKSFVFCRN